jgi:hypothetical protein
MRKQNSADTKLAEWTSRILRWVLGLLFTTVGIVFYDEGGWVPVAFGLLFFITGFFRPRCLNNNCRL